MILHSFWVDLSFRNGQKPHGTRMAQEMEDEKLEKTCGVKKDGG